VQAGRRITVGSQFPQADGDLLKSGARPRRTRTTSVHAEIGGPPQKQRDLVRNSRDCELLRTLFWAREKLMGIGA